MPIGTPQGNLDIKNATLRTSNLETQNIKIGSIFVGTGNSLEETANVGNTTSNTIQFTNTHTAFTTTGNVSVGGELTVTGITTAAGFVGNASTATKLAGTVNIGGVAFDGSEPIVPTTFGAATFSGDVTVASSKFSFDTNGTSKQENLGGNGRYIKLMKYFGDASNWKIVTGSYAVNAWQWINMRVKMVRLDGDVKTIQFNFHANNEGYRVREPMIIGTSANNEVKVYVNTSTLTYEIYIQTDSASSVEVEISHRNSTIDDDYSTVAAGAVSEAGLTKIYDSSTTTDFIVKSGNVGIGTTDPDTDLHVYGAAQTNIYLGEDGSTDKAGIIKYFQGDGTGTGVLHIGHHGDSFSSTQTLCIKKGGNVGIGTTSPGSTLTVGDGVNPTSGEAVGSITVTGTGSTKSLPGKPGIYHRAGVGLGLWSDAHMSMEVDGTNGIIEAMRIKNNGKVGIGTTDPDSKLQIKPNHTSYSNPAATSGLAIYNETNSDPSITHSILLLRTGGSSGGDPFISYDVSGEHGWSVGIDNSAGRELRFGESWSSFGSTRAYISPGSSANEIDFTGQHRSFISNVPHTEYLNLEGLIVSANKNQYFDIQEEIVTGVQAIKINESLPLVSISNVAYDKCCFGVISGSEDTNDREYSQGSFVSVLKKQDGDIRAHINSVGEGAIWVTNLNGTLESGDYITTSNVAGYGQKQDSEFLANYTVAKITMDCDFNPSTQPNRIIKRELRDVNYWVKYTYDDISEEEYTRVKNLGRRVRIIESGTEISQEEYENHLKKEGYTETESNTYIRNDTTYQRVFSDKEKEPTEGYELEVRNEPANILDEHGQIQWEDHATETEKVYKIRYLDENGVITDEASAVHTAAFVGCTYHCG